VESGQLSKLSSPATSVADLGAGCDGTITPLFEKIFSIFPSKSNEKQVHTTSNASQKAFFAYNRTPPPPFQNPRSANELLSSS
jgi:hypothetical protein